MRSAPVWKTPVDAQVQRISRSFVRARLSGVAGIGRGRQLHKTKVARSRALAPILGPDRASILLAGVDVGVSRAGVSSEPRAAEESRFRKANPLRTGAGCAPERIRRLFRTKATRFHCDSGNQREWPQVTAARDRPVSKKLWRVRRSEAGNFDLPEIAGHTTIQAATLIHQLRRIVGGPLLSPQIQLADLDHQLSGRMWVALFGIDDGKQFVSLSFSNRLIVLTQRIIRPPRSFPPLWV